MAESFPRIPVIIDCDPGTDDAFALLLAFASPELEVVAVTVVGGNVGLERTVPNALALTALAGASVPVFAGADRPLLGAFRPEPDVHGRDGLGGVRLPVGGEAKPEHAADAIRRILRDASRPVTLVGIGPATNLGLALATEPRLAENIAQIVLMTGAWGEGNATPAAEFNAFNDPEALQIVLSCRRPIVLVTLELTAQALATPARLATLRAAGSGRCMAALCDIQGSISPSPRLGGLGAPLHDPCTIAWLIRPELFTSRDCSAHVELAAGASRGRTMIDRWGRTGAAANVTVLESMDADGFFDLLTKRICKLL
ncbi:MAG TPA: nucleoside hydrolase [Acetobacteraceae bacterium]|nr:nucleoside hydrolase [Acetobacteraceae bacterium]